MGTRPIGSTLVCLALLAGCGAGATGGSSGAREPGTAGAGEGGSGAATQKAAKVPPAGTRALEKRSASLTFDLTLKKGDAAGGMQAGSWSLEEERSLEVLESDATGVRKLRVVFGRREAKPLLGVELTAATAGHGYVLESQGGAIDISRADGKEVSGAERDALMAEYDWVGGPPPLARWLGAGGIAEGQRLEGGSAETRALVGVLAGVDYANAKVEVTGKGKRGKILGLDVTTTLTLVGGNTRFELTLKGPAEVDLDTGWVRTLALKGAARASGTLEHKKGTLEVTGKGEATLNRSAE